MQVLKMQFTDNENNIFGYKIEVPKKNLHLLKKHHEKLNILVDYMYKNNFKQDYIINSLDAFFLEYILN